MGAYAGPSWKIVLSAEARGELERCAASMTAPYGEVQRAKVVLYAADGLSTAEIARRLDLTPTVVARWRRRFWEQHPEALRDGRVSAQPHVSPVRRGGRGFAHAEAAWMDAPRAVIAADHTASRLGMLLALEADGFVVVAETATAEDTVAAAVAQRPHACLVDSELPGGCLAAATAISECLHETVVVVLAASADVDDMLAAFRAGASGYLLKSISAWRLPVVVRGVLAGETAIPRALLSSILAATVQPDARRQMPLRRELRAGLTPREWQVMDLMSEGLATREIAARLGIAEVTVRRHLSGVLRTLRVRDGRTAVGVLTRGRPSS
jgi:two-component system nitrate/nitrite response regulator NarL